MIPVYEHNKFYIHQTWKNSTVPAKWQSSHQHAQELCAHDPSMKYILWTDEMNRELIAQHYPWFLVKYDSYPKPIMKCDVARSFMLHWYGGLYLDLDMDPNVEEMGRFLAYVRNTTQPPWTYVFGTENKWGDQHFTNCIMASVKRADLFWTAVWEMYKQPYQKRWKLALSRMFPKYFPPLFRTGPGTICDASQKEPVRSVSESMLYTIDKFDHSPKLVTFLQGKSWHESNDSQRLNNFKTFWQHRDALLWPIMIISMVLAIVFIVKYVKLKKKL